MSVYKITFNGNILPSFSEDSVKESCITSLNMDTQKVEQLFSGKTYTLKKQLTAAEADGYQHQLEAIGLLVTVVADEEKSRTIDLASALAAPQRLMEKIKAIDHDSLTAQYQREISQSAHSSIHPLDDDSSERTIDEIAEAGFKLPLNTIAAETFNQLSLFLLKCYIPLLIAVVITYTLSAIFGSAMALFANKFTNVLFLVLQSFGIYILAAGNYKITLNFYRDQPLVITDIFWGFSQLKALTTQFLWLLLYLLPITIALFFSVIFLFLIVKSLGLIMILLMVIGCTLGALLVYSLFTLILPLFVRDPSLSAQAAIKASYRIVCKQYGAFIGLFFCLAIFALLIMMPSTMFNYFTHTSSSILLRLCDGLLSMASAFIASAMFFLALTISCDEVFKRHNV